MGQGGLSCHYISILNWNRNPFSSIFGFILFPLPLPFLGLFTIEVSSHDSEYLVFKQPVRFDSLSIGLFHYEPSFKSCQGKVERFFELFYSPSIRPARVSSSKRPLNRVDPLHPPLLPQSLLSPSKRQQSPF